jgi:hypothetical protein
MPRLATSSWESNDDASYGPACERIIKAHHNLRATLAMELPLRPRRAPAQRENERSSDAQINEEGPLRAPSAAAGQGAHSSKQLPPVLDWLYPCSCSFLWDGKDEDSSACSERQ